MACKEKPYRFIVRFKKIVSKKDRNKIMERVLRDKSIDSVIGAINLYEPNTKKHIRRFLID